MDEDEFWIDAEEEPEDVASVDEAADSLDNARIRRRLLVRRNAVRARSFLLIVGTVLALAALRFGWSVLIDVRAGGWTLWPITFAVLAAGSLAGAAVALRRAAAEKQLYDAAAPPPAEHEPTFDGLGDGALPPDRRLEELR